VATTSVIVENIQDFFDFVDGKTTSKDGINPPSIEDVFYKEISGCLMVNVLYIMLIYMRPKILCIKVDDEVIIPGVIGGDEEEVFIEKIHIDR